MSAVLPHLLSSDTLGNGLVLKNRVVMAPLTRGRAGPTRIPNDLMLNYYAQRSSAGMVITEATAISEQANGWAQSPGIYTPEMAAGWKRIVDTVHNHGSIITCQLWHMGRASHSSFQPGNVLPVAPSAIAITGPGTYNVNDKKVPYEVPRALEIDELPGIVNDYRQAAKYALEAGFDMIELHGANGYLLDEFLQSESNRRTDRYGGSVENRFRFIREVVSAVYEVYPSDRVGIRLSPNGNAASMGSEDNIETFTYAVQELAAMNIGFIHMISSDALGFHRKCRLMTLDDFRALYSGTIIGNGGYTSESAESAIASGAADLIAFGRPFISNPDLVERFAHGWPLAEPDFTKSYTHDEEGYTDYPPYQQS